MLAVGFFGAFIGTVHISPQSLRNIDLTVNGGTGRLLRLRPTCLSLGNDAAFDPGFLGVSGDRLVGDEADIALNRETEAAFDFLDFGEADVAQLGTAEAQVAQTK